jgi:hypothetical protein
MIDVAGGTYRERCREPSWDELYGSGLRAACLISSLGASSKLHTLISTDKQSLLRAIASQHGIEVSTEAIPHTIGFFYQHGMATPEVEPDPRRLDHDIELKDLKIEGDQVLCFGFIEGSVTVKGRSVVYDPQSPTRPNPFRERGCEADRLVVIANRSELIQLAETEDVAAACQKVLQTERAEAVVAKLGPAGCLVVTADGTTSVPAFRTQRVFPIGSGDVFSAAFAVAWMEQGKPPALAADFASRTAAFFCERRTFPKAGLPDWNPLPLVLRPDGMRKAVYLAGPFFNAGQRWIIDELRVALCQAGLSVFSPMHDVGPGPAEAVWKPDIEGLLKCGVVLACLDGLDPGTIYEIGYAHARSIPVIALVSAEREEDLKMVRGGGCEVVDDIPTAVYKTVWSAVCQ